MFFDTRYIFASEVKYNWLSQMFFLSFFFSSHISSKLVASTFLCLVDSVVVHKKLRTLMSTPFANVICRLLSHLHFLMSKLKRAQDHLQNVISRTLALFWESFALVTTMLKSPFSLWFYTLETLSRTWSSRICKKRFQNFGKVTFYISPTSNF